MNMKKTIITTITFVFITCVRCCPHLKGCSLNMTVNWWQIPPYAHQGPNGGAVGVLKLVVESIMRECCGQCITFKYLPPGKNSQDLKIGANNSVLNFPVYGKRISEEINGKPYFPILESPGVVYLKKLPDAGDTAYLVIKSGAESWNVIMVAIMMGIVSGILMWMFDAYSNYDQFPKSFWHGVWNGIWWSMVTMTTVGYGDKVPRTVFARTLAIGWVFIGIVIFAVFSARITSGLTSNSLDKDETIFGKKIVVMRHSEEKRFAIKNNAVAVEVDTIEEFARSIKSGETKGGLVDSYVAGYQEDLLNESQGLIVAGIYDYQFMYGLVLSNELNNPDVSKCLRKSLSMNEQNITQMLTAFINALPEMDQEQLKKFSTSVFSPESILFQTTAIYCFIIVAVLIACGALWQLVWRPMQEKKHNNKVCPVVVVKDATMVVNEYESRDAMQKHQLKELEDAMVTEVCTYMQAFKRRQTDMMQLLSNPVLFQQLPGLMAFDEIHFAKYEPPKDEYNYNYNYQRSYDELRSTEEVRGGTRQERRMKRVSYM